ncbi:MAG: prepilin-type N-terminal cleavage/methylation domain-containing protein [Propylenella sp.]
MSGRRIGRRARRDAGFTLLEILVAVLVLAALVSIVPRSLVAARTNLEHSKDWLAARLVAETVLNEALSGSSLRAGEMGGEVDGRRWTATLKVVRTPPRPDGSMGHVLLDVEVRVEVSDGRTLKVETLRYGVPR